MRLRPFYQDQASQSWCVFSADILHYLVWWCHECATQSTNTNFLYLPLNLFYIICMPTLWTLDLEPSHYIEVCTSQSSKHLQITNKKILTAQDITAPDLETTWLWQQWERVRCLEEVEAPAGHCHQIPCIVRWTFLWWRLQSDAAVRLGLSNYLGSPAMCSITLGLRSKNVVLIFLFH